MKALKRILGAFIAGQTAILRKNDESFKQGFEKKQGLDKIGFVFERLFHFNQELFTDTKQTLERLDINTELTKAKDRIATEADKITGFVTDQTTKVETMSKDKAQTVVSEAEKRVNALQDYVNGYAKEMISKYHLEDKLTEVKKTYELLKLKVDDIKKA